jgi:hypothetical protein
MDHEVAPSGFLDNDHLQEHSSLVETDEQPPGWQLIVRPQAVERSAAGCPDLFVCHPVFVRMRVNHELSTRVACFVIRNKRCLPARAAGT